MKKSEKARGIWDRIEILVTILLFFTMLISCGMYIDIRINGQTSSLPPIPPYEKQILLKTGAAENKVYRDNLLQPAFVGIKEDQTSICATFDREARNSLVNLVNPVLSQLFSGTSEQIVFEDETHKYEYIKELTNTEKYVLVSYYDEIHAGLFLPCLSDDYKIAEKPMNFGVKHIFLLSDENENVYAVALSENNDGYILKSSANIAFDKFSAKEYDVSDGYSYFSFSDEGVLMPVLTSSFVTCKYNVETMCKKYGKDDGSLWVDKLFDVFSLNSSFVKSFSSKNDTEVNYVDDENELHVNDDGYVEFISGSVGVSLEKYLDYSVDETGKYSFSDKVFAVKNLVNSMNFDNSEHGNCVVGIDYNQDDDILSVYLKSFVNGVSITENEYDAVFEIAGNYLVYANFYAVRCSSTQEYTVCLNQSYVNELFEDEADIPQGGYMYYPVLEKEIDGKFHKVNWARIFSGNEEV